MQTPALRIEDDFGDDSNLPTFKNLLTMPKAETSYTHAMNKYKPDETGEPGESDCSITIKNGPRKRVVMQIHEKDVMEQQFSTQTSQFTYSYERERKTMIVYNGHIKRIKNTNPYLTCADVGRDVDNNNFDGTNFSPKFYQCENCEKFFSGISEYRIHLVKVVTHVCNSCGKGFQNYVKYILHRIAHGNPERECSGCRKVMANKYSLKRHISICNKMLTRKLRKFRNTPGTASN